MAKVTTRSGRTLEWPVVSYIAKSVSFDTPGISTAQTVEVGHLPEGAIVTDILVKITTAFNAATTNVLLVGTDSSNNELVAAADVNEGAAATTRVTTGLGYVVGTGGEVVYVQYTQSGTAATAGAATIIVMFIPRVG